MSMRDQLMKAGLVSKDEVRRQDAEKRKQGHKRKKDKKLADEEAQRRARAEQDRQARQQEQQERDRELNRRRQAERARREAAGRLRQLLADHRLNDRDAQLPYNFLYDQRFIRSVRVTSKQQRQLAMGKLGLLRNPDNEFDYPLVTREVAEKVGQLDPALVLVLHEETERLEDDWPLG